MEKIKERTLLNRLERLEKAIRIKEVRSRWVEDLCLSLKVAERLLNQKTYQEGLFVKSDPGKGLFSVAQKKIENLREILLRILEKIDIEALEKGRIKEFYRSLERIKEFLSPLKEFAQEYTISLVGNAHIDLAWLWRWRESVQICRGTFGAVLELMEEFPSFTFSQSQAQTYQWMEEFYSEIFEGIKEKVREGRWEIVGGMWVESDGNLLDGESWVNQIFYGKEYFQTKFGVEVKVAWLSDSFGYNYNLPQFLRKGGMDYFLTQKLNWNDTNLFPYRLFWWEGPDGSRILSYFPYSGNLIQPYKMVDYLKQFEASSGLTHMLWLFGVGDHGGGPTREMLEEVERLNRLPIYPRVKFNTSLGYFEELEKEVNFSSLPGWKGELYLEYHRGTYTTQSAIKKKNRECEVLLETMERLNALVGGDFFLFKEKCERLWKKVLFNQFHDILPGSSIPAVYKDTKKDYEEVEKRGREILSSLLNSLERKIDTSSLGEEYIVSFFNPLCWERTEPVELDFSLPGEWKVESEDKSLPTQRTEKGLLFLAQRVPGFGFSSFQIKKGSLPSSGLKVGKYFLENGYLRVEINPKTGNLLRIQDLEKDREVLSPQEEGNSILLLEDKPKEFDSWNIEYTGRKWEIEKPDSIEVVEEGPLRGILRIKKSFSGEGKRKYYGEYFALTPGVDTPSSYFVQDIILYQGLKRVDFRFWVDWWEDHILLKVCFTFSLPSPRAIFGLPYGSIERSTFPKTPQDKAKFEVPFLNWVDLSTPDYGIALLTRAKYGCDIKGAKLRLTLLRSPASKNPTSCPDPLCDRGEHEFFYSLYPHSGEIKITQIIQKGYEFNYPLLPFSSSSHQGELPPRFGLLKVDSGSVLVSHLKRKNKSTLLLRLEETQGKEGEAELSFPFPLKKAEISDFWSNSLLTLPLKKGRIRVKLKPYEILNLKLTL